MEGLVRFAGVVVLVFTLSTVTAAPSHAARYTKNTPKSLSVLYCGLGGPCAYFPVSYSISHRVEGSDSVLEPDKIFVREVAVNGFVYNYSLLPFGVYIAVSNGELREAALPDYITQHTFSQGDLSQFSLIYDPKHQPWWGGEQVGLSVYMNRRVNAWQYADVFIVLDDGGVWRDFRNGNDSFVFHTINGWQNQ